MKHNHAFRARSSVLAVAAAMMVGGTAAAQTVAGADLAPEIIVTGTSLRGQAPIGSNLIAVSSDALEATGAQTITDSLRSVPALSNMGGVGQGPNAAFFAPSIHNLGASASNSTLVLVDGHRGPTGGTNHTFIDPNMIPSVMLERVDVLPEGASSVYGSDAVAGVVNFITRKEFNGFRADVSHNFTKNVGSTSIGLLAGKTWEGGSAVFGFQYSNNGALAMKDRDFLYPDHRADGGRSFLNFSCPAASVQVAGDPLIYPNVSAAGVVNNPNNASCSNYDYADSIGSEVRHRGMAKITLDLSDDLTVGLDMLISRRRNSTRTGAGSIQATVFGAGAQANPFLQLPTAYTGSGTTETIRWDSTDLLGVARSMTGSDTYMGVFTATYDLGNSWTLDGLVSVGRDVSGTWSEGTLNQSSAMLALNGTTNGGGNLSLISVPGTDLVITQLPLTTANALDVWNSGGANRTSADVIKRLRDNDNLTQNEMGYQQYRVVLNGPIADAPAGAVNVAVGAELYRMTLDQHVKRANGSGPASSGSQQLNFAFGREVKSFFGEMSVPLVSPDMDVPGVQKFDVNLAGRYDRYSDFGSTTNPKVSFGWDVVDSLRFRGNYSTSFVAPSVNILGDEHGAFGTAGVRAASENVTVPVGPYPALAQMGIPGCTLASAVCNISNLQGVTVVSGDHNAGPMKGHGWSLGADFTPTAVPGLRASLTLFSTTFRGAITGTTLTNILNTASANHLLTFYPAGATLAEYNALAEGIPLTTALPSRIDYIRREFNSNWLNLDIRGLDYQIGYSLPTIDAGTFRAELTGTHFLRYMQSFGSGKSYSILNTTGNNGTFPSVQDMARANLGWSLGAVSLDSYFNYVGSYRNWSGNSMNPITRDANGNPGGGGDKVSAKVLVDLRFAYDLDGLGIIDGAQFTVTAANIFDKRPPFYNGSSGYDVFTSNPFGRRINVGLRLDMF